MFPISRTLIGHNLPTSAYTAFTPSHAPIPFLFSFPHIMNSSLIKTLPVNLSTSLTFTTTMAATAAATAAMSSSFSTSIHTTLKCMRSNYHYLQLRISTPTRMLSSSSSLSAHSCVIDQPVVSRRVLRIPCASVDLAVTKEVEEEVVAAEEEKQAEEEVVVPPAAEVSSEAAVPTDELPVNTELFRPKKKNTKLYFGNLPDSVDSAQLAGIIQDYASPELIEVVYHKDTGKSRGFAFVTMSSVEDCNTVIENLHGREFSGRALRVNFQNPKLYFGNLPDSADSAQLAGIIQDYASPELIEVVYHKDTGKSRGFAFVTMSSVEDCNAVIENLHGREFSGRALRVNFQNPKLYFGNLPDSVDSAQLAGIIQDYASPELIEVVYHKDTGKSRGFAFVTMSSVEDCNAIIENLDGREFSGRVLRVNFQNPKVYFGNLPDSVDSAQLARIIQDYASPELVEVVYHKDTGKSRGFAFVTMSSVEDCNAIIENLDGREYRGRALMVNFKNRKLYFGNLPYIFDSAQLAGIIQDYASPELIEVVYHKGTGKSRGFAFVTMSSVEDCNVVIENLDGREYSGRALRVNFWNKPKPKEPLYPETEYKLFVSNLSLSTTSESLTIAFQEYGNVVGARVLYDGETGRSRCFGFVCFSTKAEMETALQSLDRVELGGRAMRVRLAKAKRS